MEEQGGKAHGHQDAQLVDGHHHAGGPVPQRPVIAQPGGPGGQAGQADKAQLSPGHGPKRRALSREEHHRPGHDQHHAGADRRGQVGVHTRDAQLPQDGGKAGEDGGAQGEGQPQPGGAAPSPALFLYHQPGPHPHAEGAHGLPGADRLPQEDDGQENRQHGAALVHRRYLVDVPQLQGLEIAQPGGPGGQAREDQIQQRPPPYGPQAGLGAGEEDHPPGKGQHDDGSDSGGHGGIRPADAALCQDGRESREQRGAKREEHPHRIAFF